MGRCGCWALRKPRPLNDPLRHLRRDLPQGIEHEIPLMGETVRQVQPLAVELQPFVSDDVDINQPRPLGRP